MGKIRLKFAFTIILCVYSCFFVFAEDKGNESEKNSPPKTTEANGSGATENIQQTSGGGGDSSKGADSSTGQKTNGSASGAKNTPPPPPQKPAVQSSAAQKPVIPPTKYKVTFDAVGGKVSPSFEQVNNGEFVGKLPKPEKEGYHFEHWVMKKDDGSEIEFKDNMPVEKDMIVYAKWIPVYTVTFEADNDEKIPPEKIKKEQTVKKMPADPKKEGYHFVGWFTKEDDGETEFKDNASIKKDMAVYAKWVGVKEILSKLSELENNIEKLNNNIENNNIKKVEKKVVVLFGVVCVFVLFLIALNIILSRKNKNKILLLEKKVDVVEKKYDDIRQEFARYDSFIENRPRRLVNIGSSSPDSSAKDVADLRKEIGNLQNHIQEIEKNVRDVNERKIMFQEVTSGSRSVMDAFNLWAGNPSTPLPHEIFYYIEGEMYIRSPREIKESAGETKWITNRIGAQKYLFPNPNSFNPNTDIHLLYKMDQARLKEKGQNKIRITTSCKMTKDGFVEFSGELELL
jgi:uncharacterized repeat protein (TIGR02543 family)